MSKITVALCVFNQEDFVCKALESIKNQTYSDFILQIIDNGSTDSTPQKIKDYLKTNTFRNEPVFFRYEQNNNITKVFNSIVKSIQTDYICFIAGDDYYVSNYLDDHLSVLENLPGDYGLVYSDYLILDREHNLHSGNSFNQSGFVFYELVQSQLESFISPFTPMYKKEIFDKFLYNENNFSEGEAFLIRVSSKFKFKFINSKSYVMLDHDNNQGKNYKENATFFIKNTEFQISEFPEHKKLFSKIASKMMIRYAWIVSRLMDDKKTVLQFLIKAIKYDFRAILNTRFYGVIILLIFGRIINNMLRPKAYKGKVPKAIDRKYANK